MLKSTSNYRSAVLAGLLASLTPALATDLAITTPAPSGYPDTESSVVVSLASWGVYTPPVKLTMETNNSTSNAVQIAFGHDLNGDADLQPEETELIFGYDCGTWFIRDERSIEEQLFYAASTSRGTDTLVRSRSSASPTADSRTSHTFNFRLANNPSDRWDIAKVTTRGRADSAASIAAQIFKPHFYIIVK